MMSLLEQYEHQYSALVAEITAFIGKVQQLNGYERHQLCSTVDARIAEAQELLEQMSLEIRELNSTQRHSFTNRLNCYQVELKRLQNEYNTSKDVLMTKYPTNANTSFDIGGGEDGEDYFDDVSIRDDQRQRLLENSERIERSGNRLTEGYSVALETEALGAQILNDLSQQRDTLTNARARLRDTNADLGRASRTLNSMMLRALREKAVIYGVGIFFLFAILISLYLTFSSSASAN